MPEPSAEMTALVALLARLRRKGARLEPATDPKTGGYQIVYPGERRRTSGADKGLPSRSVSAELVAVGRSRGWLAPVAGHPVADGDVQAALRLTEAGALVAHRGTDHLPRKSRAEAEPITAPTTRRARATLSPLARLRQMRDGKGAALITSAQAEAGERLARDFIKGQMMPRVTANWDRAALGFGAEPGGSRQGAGTADVSDGAATAQQRVRRALAAAGPTFADLLIDVCCLELNLEVVEKRRAWPAGTGRVVLALGLDALSQHYGIVATGPARGRTAHWGTADYRPTLTGSAPEPDHH